MQPSRIIWSVLDSISHIRYSDQWDTNVLNVNKKKPDSSPYSFLSTIGKGRDMVSFQKRERK